MNAFEHQDKLKITPAPAWIRPQENDWAGLAANPHDAPYGLFYLLDDYQINVSDDANYLKKVYKIVNSSGIQYGSDIKIQFNPLFETLEIHSIRIFRGQEVIDQTDLDKFRLLHLEKEMDRFVYNATLGAVMNLEDIQAGDIIVSEFTIRGANPILNGRFARRIFLQHPVYLEQIHLLVTYPSERPLTLKHLNTAAGPVTQTNNAMTTLEWNLRQVPALAMENETVYWYNPYPYVLLSEFASWKELATWAARLFECPEDTGGPLTRAIEKIRAKAAGDEGIILEEVLRLVQDDIRYLSVDYNTYNYRPHQPRQVFEQRFGDCKDKSLLMVTMLRAMGIEAYPVLVNTQETAAVKDWLPAPSVFNHAIVQAVTSKGELFFDPTLTAQGGLWYEKSVPAYGWGLVIRESAEDLVAITSPGTTGVEYHEEFDVKEVNGETILKVTTRYLGSEADAKRQMFQIASHDDVQRDLLNYYMNTYSEMTAERPYTIEDDRTANCLTLKETYIIRNPWKPQKDSGNGKYALTLLPTSLGRRIQTPYQKVRSMPFGLPHPCRCSQFIRVNLPERWEVETQKNTITGQWHEFRSDIQAQDKTVMLNYEYRTLTDHIRPEAVKEYCTQVDSIYNHLGFVLYKEIPGAGQKKVNPLLFLLLVPVTGLLLMMAVLAAIDGNYRATSIVIFFIIATIAATKKYFS